MHFKVNEETVFGSTCRVQRRCLVVWSHWSTQDLLHCSGGGGTGEALVCIASRLYW